MNTAAHTTDAVAKHAREELREGSQSRTREDHFWTHFKRLSAELKVLVVGLCLWIIGIMAGLPPVPLTFASTMAFQVTMVMPIVGAFLFQIVFTFLPINAKMRQATKEPLYFFKMTPILFLIFFLYLNFKSWMPLVNPTSFDHIYYAIDTSLQPVIDGFINVRMTIAKIANYHDIDRLYFTAFWSMFVFSFIFHGLFDTHHNQRRIFLGLMLNLLLGGLAYSITPTVGPFLYRQGVSEVSTNAQGYMYELFSSLQTTGVMPKDYLGFALGAMPSLHIAHTLFFTMAAARSLRWLLIFYIPCFGWFFVECVSSSWHYLLDIPGGIALCLLTWYLIERLLPTPAAESQAHASTAPKRKNPRMTPTT